MVIDVLEREELPFPHSLPEFQRLFPDDAACAEYLERARWRDGFVCPHCAVADEPRYVSTRLKVLRCRHCRRDTSLTAGTVMERTHTPLSVWFWGRTWLPARRPACRLSSSSANSGCRATKPLSKFFTSCVSAWCAPTRTGSAARRTRPSKPTKPGLVAARGVKGFGEQWNREVS